MDNKLPKISIYLNKFKKSIDTTHVNNNKIVSLKNKHLVIILPATYKYDCIIKQE